MLVRSESLKALTSTCLSMNIVGYFDETVQLTMLIIKLNVVYRNELRKPESWKYDLFKLSQKHSESSCGLCHRLLSRSNKKNKGKLLSNFTTYILLFMETVVN